MDSLSSLLAAHFGPRLKIAQDSDVTTLLEGPSGTGKTTLARRIHDESSRKLGPFLSINLATLHEGTLEGTLFGQERGAFTGADHAKPGLLALAHEGTVFLDEVAELSLPLQARLLEFLQTKKIRALGAAEERALDVRILAATNRDLEREVAEKRFREDLLYRLRILSLRAPTLYELRDHFDGIVHAFLEELARAEGKSIHSLHVRAARLLESYDWPGNYRELRGALQCAVLSARGRKIRVEDLPEWLAARTRARKAAATGEPLAYREALLRFQTEFFEKAAKRGYGNLALAARISGMSRSAFLRHYRRLRL